MTYYYNAGEDCPDLDIERVRDDFLCIWKKNVIDMKLIRKNKDFDVVEDGDFFDTNTKSITTETTIQINIQSIPRNFKRDDKGITNRDTIFNCFVKYDTDIQNDDILVMLEDNLVAGGINLFKDNEFIIQGLQEGFYDGQFGFKEFQIKRVGKNG